METSLATLTAKGQETLPRVIHQALSLGRGDRLCWISLTGRAW